MADTRSLQQKLEAVIAADSGATEGERRNARALLERLAGSVRAGEATRAGLSRDAILQSPSFARSTGERRVQMNGYWITVSEDEYDILFGEDNLFKKLGL